MTLSPHPHRECIPGPDATEADLLPPEVVAVLRQEGRNGARAAQAALDAAGVPDALLPAVAAQLSAQPGTGPWWRRWWAGWRRGALLAC